MQDPTDDGRADEPDTANAPIGDDPGAVAATVADAGTTMTVADAACFPVEVETLWDAISDPAAIAGCVPGAREIERLDEGRYGVTITRGVSHLTLSLSGELAFVESSPPDYLVASGAGHDATTGSDLAMLAAMELSPVAEPAAREGVPDDADAAVELAYSAEVGLTGGVASLGTEMLRPIVKRDVTAFFGNLRGRVTRR
ncbi:MAG: CoxG family protein [Halobacteriaceae archaeon]